MDAREFEHFPRPGFSLEGNGVMPPLWRPCGPSRPAPSYCSPQHRKAAKRARRAARDAVVPYDLGRLLAVLERQAVGITR